MADNEQINKLIKKLSERMGTPESDIRSAVNGSSYSKLLRKQLTVFGSWNADRRSDVDDWKESLDAVAKGLINPEALITHRIPLENGLDAWKIIGDRKTFYNKITLVM